VTPWVVVVAYRRSSVACAFSGIFFFGRRLRSIRGAQATSVYSRLTG
jgi:hypothetical protein